MSKIEKKSSNSRKDILEKVKTENGMFSLNGLYELADCPKNKDPRTWLKQENVQDLIATVQDLLNVTLNHIIKTKRGKGGGTQSHRQIALAYAKYLDPKLHALVN